MTKPKLLIVDDDAEIRTQMKWALAQDFELFVAQDRPSALAVFRKERPAVVTLDLGLPPDAHGVEEGFRTLRALLKEDALTKVIIATGQDERQYALEALEQGAYGSNPRLGAVYGVLTGIAYSGFLLTLRQGSRDLRRRRTAVHSARASRRS